METQDDSSSRSQPILASNGQPEAVPAAAFTPGPWVLEEDDWGHRICMGDAITSPYNHETQNLVRYEHGCDPNEPSGPARAQYNQAFANARLIAAAPDLLAAVLHTRELVSGAAMSGFVDEDAIRALFVNNGTLTAAIAKALGREAASPLGGPFLALEDPEPPLSTPLGEGKTK